MFVCVSALSLRYIAHHYEQEQEDYEEELQQPPAVMHVNVHHRMMGAPQPVVPLHGHPASGHILPRNHPGLYPPDMPQSHHRFFMQDRGVRVPADAYIDHDRKIERVTIPAVDGASHTDNLHDFNTGFSALKAAGRCFIQPLDRTLWDRNHAAEEQSDNKVIEARHVDKKIVPGSIHGAVLRFTAGHDIAEFCAGAPAQWIVDDLKEKVDGAIAAAAAATGDDEAGDKSGSGDERRLRRKRQETGSDPAPAPGSDGPDTKPDGPRPLVDLVLPGPAPTGTTAEPGSSEQEDSGGLCNQFKSRVCIFEALCFTYGLVDNCEDYDNADDDDGSDGDQPDTTTSPLTATADTPAGTDTETTRGNTGGKMETTGGVPASPEDGNAIDTDAFFRQLFEAMANQQA